MRWTEEEYKNYLRKSEKGEITPSKYETGLQQDGSTPKQNKFHNILSECDNIKFHSKKEKKYYQDLKARVHMGEVKYFLRQVPIRLHSGIKYVVDFIEFWTDGQVKYIDVKGMRTKEYKLKKKLVEDEFPIRIEEA